MRMIPYLEWASRKMVLKLKESKKQQLYQNNIKKKIRIFNLVKRLNLLKIARM